MKFFKLAALLATVTAIHLKTENMEDPKTETTTKTTAAGGTNAYVVGSHDFADLPDITGGFQAGQHFQLKSRADNNLVMYITSQSEQHKWGAEKAQWLVQTRAAEGSSTEFWFWHAESGTIRSVSNSDLVLTFEDGTLADGTKSVVKHWSATGEN